MSYLFVISKRVFLPFSLLLLLSFISCQHGSSPKGKGTYLKEGKAYGVTKGLFRERWWNFYERGCSFASGEFWDEAISDFKEALKQRDKDGYRARTYGMHFIDYFPLRELGIAYYYTDQYPKAIEALTTSLSQVETAKAKYFLNMARRGVLQQTQSDKIPPSINHLLLSDGYTTNLFDVELTGVVEDDTFVSSITINDSPLFIELAKKKIPFSQEVSLKRGDNFIRIEAKDLTGKVTTQEIKVLVDREGPLVSISEPLENETVRGSEVTIKGFLWDESGIESFELRGEKLALNSKKEASFSQKVILAEGENSLPFEVRDSIGNLTRGEFHLVYNPQASISRTSLAPFIRLAFLNRVVTDVGGYPLLVRAETDDHAPPSISLKELTDFQTVYYDTIFIEGSVSDQSEIREITINTVPLRIRPGKHLFFNYLSQLQEGVNCFKLKVTDAFGNAAAKTITVTRKIPKVKKVGSRLAIALIPFEQKGEGSTLGSLVYDGLVDAFVNQGRFNIVGRERDFEVALRELKLSQTDLVDKTKALKLGRIVSAEGIIAGTVTETPNSIEIYARFIDTETATILSAKDVFEQDKSLAKLNFILRGLALKFEQSFPLLEGRVVKSKGKKVYVDRGSRNKIKKEMKIIIFREGEPILHPITGRNLGRDTLELAEARIESVLDNFSIGKVLNYSAKVEIREKDHIITK
jgi:tetratricopeptide (TPR) repeat protein